MADEFQTSLQNSASNSTMEDNHVPFYQLPTELVLEIVSLIPSHSRASLALCSGRLYNTLFEHLQAPDLQLPREQPPNFQESIMSHPGVYRPKRWAFLCLIEKDCSEWRLCSACFKLHPIFRFIQEELEKKPEDRTCNANKPTGIGFGSSDHASGIVDLCPCRKLTWYGKTKLEYDILRSMDEIVEPEVGGAPKITFYDSSSDDWLMAESCGHTCRQQYGDVVLDIQVKAWVDRCFSLSISTCYRYKCPVGRIAVLPRLCCPHRRLSSWVNQLVKCRDTHPDQSCCRQCYDMQKCRYCDTIMYELEIMRCKSGQAIIYTFRTERNLDDSHWNSQIVFPFNTHHKKVSQHHHVIGSDYLIDDYPVYPF